MGPPGCIIFLLQEMKYFLDIRKRDIFYIKYIESILFQKRGPTIPKCIVRTALLNFNIFLLFLLTFAMLT